MGTGVNESHFYMWRALFALAHADDEVHDNEVRFMAEALEDVDFSEAQRVILNNDMHEPKDVREMYSRISDAKDQALFFKYARELVWADGSFDQREKDLLMELQKAHVQGVNLNDIVGSVELEIEGDDAGSESVHADLRQKSTKPGYDDLDDDIEIEQFTFGKFFKNLKEKLGR